jgi:hypothetical protein
VPTSAFALSAVLGGCIWLPDWPFPDTVVDEEYVEDDSRLLSHCIPEADPTRPVLLRRGESVEFHCRVRGADLVTWSFDIDDDEQLEASGLAGRAPRIQPILLGSGVERIAVHGDDLPWSPRPYGGRLQVATSEGGRQQLVTWPLVVASHADDVAQPELAP